MIRQLEVQTIIDGQHKAEAQAATGPVFDLTGTVSPPLLGLP